MAKRKYTKKRAKQNNSFIIFLAIIIVLAVISFLISYFVLETEDVATDTKIEEVENNETSSSKEILPVNIVLEGTWASYNDGAMLTIKGGKFTIELPSVESLSVVSGNILISGSTVTFVYTTKGSGCGDNPGVYEFIFDSDEEITFKKINDSCESRSNQLVATWFKV